MRVSTLVIVMAMIFSISGLAQPVLTPRNIALGGGGSTYITDYNANFYNPANLLIRDRNSSFDIGFFITGTYYNGVLNSTNLETQTQNFENNLRQYKAGSYGITPDERLQVLEDHFKRDRLTSIHQSRLESTLLGLRWRKSNKAFSLAIRTRTASSFEIGRGWYSNEPVETEAGDVLSQTLKHRYLTLNEVSFGYAESIQHLNGMSSRLDNFIVGIAPKLVLGGPYQNASWINNYTSSSGSIQQNERFEYNSSGGFSNATSAYLAGMLPQQAIANNIQPLEEEIFNIKGIGAGLDVGFTYLITLGSDLSTLNVDEQETQKSLRLSFSITDIGFVSYQEDGLVYNSQADTTTVPAFPGQQENVFVGAPGQFISFVDQTDYTNPLTKFASSSEPFTMLLPTALHGGILFEVNRLKLMGDISIGLTNTAFTTTKLTTSLGIEIRPLKFLPLRAGTQLAPQLPGFLSLGTAIETKYWDLSVATQLSTRSITTNTALTGITVAALQFHL